MKKRTFAWLIVLCMIVGMAPTAVAEVKCGICQGTDFDYYCNMDSPGASDDGHYPVCRNGCDWTGDLIPHRMSGWMVNDLGDVWYRVCNDDCRYDETTTTDPNASSGHTHSYSDATCTAPETCACGETRGSVDRENHVGGTELRYEYAPTEFEEGYTGDICCRGCGAILEYGESIPALHNYKWEWQHTPEGHWLECLDCGEKSLIVEHEFDGDADLTCDTCGYTREAHTHEWGKWASLGPGTNAHYRFCLLDANHRETEDCYGGVASCTERASCEGCGAGHGETALNNHVDLEAGSIPYDTEWIDGNGGTHWLRCCGCGMVYSETVDQHEYDNEEDVYCNVCGHDRIAGHIHHWQEYVSNGDGTHTRKCTGAITSDILHSETEACHDRADGDHLCDACGAEMATVSITTESMPDATVDEAYSLSFSYVGNISGIVFWNATGLPKGLSINMGSGLVSGTPTAAGTYEVVIAIGATGGGSASRSYTLTVLPAHTHSFSVATCTTPATCECGEIMGDVDPGKHSWGEYASNGDGSHSRICSLNSEHVETEACGGQGSCCKQAVCPVCGAQGDYDKTNHTGGTRLLNYKQVSYIEDGYTGDTYCNGCDELLNTGEVIPKEELEIVSARTVQDEYSRSIFMVEPIYVLHDGTATTEINGKVGAWIADEAIRNESDEIRIVPHETEQDAEATNTQVNISAEAVEQISELTDADLSFMTSFAVVSVSDEDLDKHEGDLEMGAQRTEDGIGAKVTIGGTTLIDVYVETPMSGQPELEEILLNVSTFATEAAQDKGEVDGNDSRWLLRDENEMVERWRKEMSGEGWYYMNKNTGVNDPVEDPNSSGKKVNANEYVEVDPEEDPEEDPVSEKTYELVTVAANNIAIEGWDEALYNFLLDNPNISDEDKAELKSLMDEMKDAKYDLEQEQMEYSFKDAEEYYNQVRMELTAAMTRLADLAAYQGVTVTQTFPIIAELADEPNVQYIAVHMVNPYADALLEVKMDEDPISENVEEYKNIQEAYDMWEAQNGSSVQFGEVALSEDGLSLIASYSAYSFSPFVVFALIEAA